MILYVDVSDTTERVAVQLYRSCRLGIQSYGERFGGVSGTTMDKSEKSGLRFWLRPCNSSIFPSTNYCCNISSDLFGAVLQYLSSSSQLLEAFSVIFGRARPSPDGLDSDAESLDQVHTTVYVPQPK